MYLSIPAAAQRLGYSVSTLQHWVKDGRLRVYRATPTSHPRVKIADLDALMVNEQPQAQAGAVDLDVAMAQAFAAMGLPTRSKRAGKSVH